MGDFQRMVEEVNQEEVGTVTALVLKACVKGETYDELQRILDWYVKEKFNGMWDWDVASSLQIGIENKWLEELGDGPCVYVTTDKGREALRRYDKRYPGEFRGMMLEDSYPFDRKPLRILLLSACKGGATYEELREIFEDDARGRSGHFATGLAYHIEYALKQGHIERIGGRGNYIFLLTPLGEKSLKQHEDLWSQKHSDTKMDESSRPYVEDNTYEYLNPLEFKLLKVCERGAPFDEIVDTYEEYTHNVIGDRFVSIWKFIVDQNWVERIGNRYDIVYLLTDEGKKVLHDFERFHGAW